jgi:hypothetical protein
MTINQSSSSNGQGVQILPKQSITDGILKSEQLQAERKKFVCTLKQNRRGRFLRISEEAGCHRNTIIIPGGGMRELFRILEGMLRLVDDSSPDPRP